MKFFAMAALSGTIIATALALPDGYGHGHGSAVEYAYPVKLPEVKCGHNLLVSCNPSHAAVPCNNHAPGPAPHYAAPAPHYGAPAPHYEAPAPHYEAPASVHHEPMVAGKHKKHRKHKKHHHHHHHG